MAHKLQSITLYSLHEGDDIVVEWNGIMVPTKVYATKVGPDGIFVEAYVDDELKLIYAEHVYKVV